MPDIKTLVERAMDINWKWSCDMMISINHSAISIAIIFLVFIQPRMIFAQIPSSDRSKKAIQNVKPHLERELHTHVLKFGFPIFIRIFKESKELEVWIKGQESYKLFRTYEICSFSGKLGPKLKQGDLQAPEGFYFVTPKRLNPWSSFHLSFDIGYPNAYDRFHNRTGSAIAIHGSCVSIGCYAMTDEKIKEIYALADGALQNGQRFFRVHIFPFRMTKENIEAHKNLKWGGFWQNLKVGYDYFEKKKAPPNVVVRQGKYIFEDVKP